MIAVFAGPSLYAYEHAASDFSVFPPARCGDILDAVQRGASVICLIDGVFESALSVWHKEILYALTLGVRVVGAASMGALRACECAAFGMEGFGMIYEEYRDGVRTSDADVAVLHAPAELGYQPLTVALADVQHASRRLAENGCLSARERLVLDRSAAAIFFKQRTWSSVLEHAAIPRARRATVLGELQRVPGQKTLDALAVLQGLGSRPNDSRRRLPPAEFNSTLLFERLHRKILDRREAMTP